MKESIQQEIKEFVLGYPKRNPTRTVWKSPVVGFAVAAYVLMIVLKILRGNLLSFLGYQSIVANLESSNRYHRHIGDGELGS